MHSVLKNSQCLNKYLHRFNIVEEHDGGVLEVCEICKKRMFFKLIDGKPDNQNYMNYHIRSALPPQHPLYFHEHEFNPLTEIISPYV